MDVDRDVDVEIDVHLCVYVYTLPPESIGEGERRRQAPISTRALGSVLSGMAGPRRLTSERRSLNGGLTEIRGPYFWKFLYEGSYSFPTIWGLFVLRCPVWFLTKGFQGYSAVP